MKDQMSVPHGSVASGFARGRRTVFSRSWKGGLTLDTPSILVVEDDIFVREALAASLRLREYRVALAANGAEGLQAIARHRPDLLILDHDMPLLDGPGVVRALTEAHVNVPIIVMSGRQEVESWAENIGAAGYLAKPFSVRDLLDTCARVCHPG